MAVAVVIGLALPQAAFSKAFKEHDNSKNNTCIDVHNWYEKTHDAHAAFATTGGIPYGQRDPKGEHCESAGGPELKWAKYYAIHRCEKRSSKLGDHRHCIVVESR